MKEVVITGVGVVSPIGIGRGPFWAALRAGRSGIGPLTCFERRALPVQISAEVHDFDPKQYVRPRKSLKVMSRDAQFAVAAVDLAWADAGLNTATVDPDRLGVVFGADRIRNEIDEIADMYRVCIVDGQFDFGRWGTHGLGSAYPLNMLKNLPNMLASHISINRDARGPNNTFCHAEASSLLAVGEAAAVIARGQADVMLAGGASSRMHPLDWVRSCVGENLSRWRGDPAAAARPFDADRTGQVRGEGAAVLVLESRQHATARRAPILARVLSAVSAYAPPPPGPPRRQTALARAIGQALRKAEIRPAEVGHVNAHGLGTIDDDRLEAQALRQALGNAPIFAPKSYFGNLAAASGAVELAASVLALAEGLVPATLNYERPDPECPIEVIHGEPLVGAAPVAVAVNETACGQVAVVVLAGEG